MAHTRFEYEWEGRWYGSRELLQAQGGLDGAVAIWKAENWHSFGLKFAPGFDKELRRLVARLDLEKANGGAVRDSLIATVLV